MKRQVIGFLVVLAGLPVFAAANEDALVSSYSDFEPAGTIVTSSEDAQAVLTPSIDVEKNASSGGGTSLIPEPSTIGLLLAGLIGGALTRVRRRSF